MGETATSMTCQWEGASRARWQSLHEDVAFLPYQQAFAFGEVIRAAGGLVLRGTVMDGKHAIATVQLTGRRLPGLKLLTALMGPVWLGAPSTEEQAAAYRAMRASLPKLGLSLTMVMPPEAEDAAERAAGLKRVVSSYHTALLDLTKGEETLLAAADGKWRNRLRAAEKADITVRPLGRRAAQYQWLLEAEAAQQKGRGYRALSPALVPAFADAAGKDSVFVFEVRDGEERLGGALFLRTGNTATYHIGWANPEGREKGAPSLLLWAAVRYGIEKGLKTLDLGGLDTSHTPGIARFKLGTGAQLLSQSGTWLLRPGLR